MEPGKYYHLYTHANGSENLFRETENYYYFIKQYRKYIVPVADTMAYCLMPNHVHFLLRLKHPSEKLHTHDADKPISNRKITQPFSNLFNSYTKAYNKRYDRMGSLFIPNFKRKEITADNYLTNVIVYIHLNPVHHGFATAPDHWTWSSYTGILNNHQDLVNPQYAIEWFGNKEEFIRLHHQIEFNQDLQGF
jgi:putative transposase